MYIERSIKHSLTQAHTHAHSLSVLLSFFLSSYTKSPKIQNGKNSSDIKFLSYLSFRVSKLFFLEQQFEIKKIIKNNCGEREREREG